MLGLIALCSVHGCCGEALHVGPNCTVHSVHGCCGETLHVGPALHRIAISWFLLSQLRMQLAECGPQSLNPTLCQLHPEF